MTRLNTDPRALGTFAWHSARSIKLDADLKAIYEYVAQRPVTDDSELLILNDGTVQVF